MTPLIKTIIGILFVLIIATIVASKQQIDLNNYEEECYQYKPKLINRTQYYCDAGYRYNMMCYNIINGSFTRFDGYQISYNIKEIDCNCPRISNRSIQLLQFTNECIKYHLIRKSG